MGIYNRSFERICWHAGTRSRESTGSKSEEDAEDD